MNENKQFEELSAYLDGEAKNPAEVQRRLESDSDAARLAGELSALSKEMGRLPAPDVHPAFRTRVMAEIRETPESARPPLISWQWRAFAAMVVLSPVAAAIWTFWWSPPPIPAQADSQRAMIRYLLEQDEDAVVDQLAQVYADDLSPAEGTPPVNGSVYLLDSVEESVWLDVLAMDTSIADWSDTVDYSGGMLTDDEMLEIESQVLERMTGDTTI